MNTPHRPTGKTHQSQRENARQTARENQNVSSACSALNAAVRDNRREKLKEVKAGDVVRILDCVPEPHRAIYAGRDATVESCDTLEDGCLYAYVSSIDGGRSFNGYFPVGMVERVGDAA